MATAACGPSSEILYDVHFAGQKCTNGAEVLRSGMFDQLTNGEKLQGDVFSVGKNHFDKRGVLKSPLFNGQYIARTDLNQGALRHEELRSGTEDLGTEGRFDGDTYTKHEKGPFQPDQLTIEKRGLLKGPTILGTLRSVTTQSMTPFSHKDVRSDVMLSGTWKIGTKKFAGDFLIHRINNQITVEDRRVPQP